MSSVVSPSRFEHCPLYIHKVAKTSDGSTETAGYLSHNISGRHVDNGPIKRAAHHSDKCSDQAASVAGICAEFREIHSGSKTSDSISRVCDRLSKDDDQPSAGEGTSDQDCEWALSLSVRDLSRLTGHMTATMQAVLPAVLPAPLCYRNLQRLKNREFSHSQSYTAKVTLDHSAKEELFWWKTQLQSWNGKVNFYVRHNFTTFDYS